MVELKSSNLLHGRQKLVNEPVKAGQILTFALGAYGKDIQHRFINCVSYLRTVDNIVDEGNYPTRVRALLARELNAIDSMVAGHMPLIPDDFPVRAMLYEGIQGLTRQRQAAVLKPIREVLQGAVLDNQAIRNQAPLSPDQLEARDLFTSKSAFEFGSQLVLERPLLEEPSSEFEDLCRTWLKYDALRDMDKDMAGGLILFPTSALAEYGIVFQAGEILPRELRAFYEEHSQTVVADLKEQSRSVFQTTLPPILASGLYSYFRTRPRKLRTTTYPVSPNTRFAERLKE